MANPAMLSVNSVLKTDESCGVDCPLTVNRNVIVSTGGGTAPLIVNMNVIVSTGGGTAP